MHQSLIRARLAGLVRLGTSGDRVGQVRLNLDREASAEQDRVLGRMVCTVRGQAAHTCPLHIYVPEPWGKESVRHVKVKKVPFSGFWNLDQRT